MIIVAGQLQVEPGERDAYLADCAEVVRTARRTAGCLDFAVSADLVEPGRINVFERWESMAAVEAFRGSGPSGAQQQAITSAAVAQYEVVFAVDL
jgi:quinol monooxygenase YgiN